MKILFIGDLPGQMTGIALACRVFLDEVVKTHTVDVINLGKPSFRSGIVSINRMLDVFSFVRNAWRKKRSVDCIYFTISQSVFGNMKDILIYLSCFDRLPNMLVYLHGGAGMRKLLKPSNRLLRAINGYFLRRVGAVIVLGVRHVDIFENLVPVERIHVVPNFAEDSLFVDKADIRSKFEGGKPLRLLLLSNLIPGKGYIELIEAFRSLDVTNFPQSKAST